MTFSSDGTTTNSGADCAKEHLLKKRAPAQDPETVLLGLRFPLSKSITTLGNGYLGSRIDEERSKMRYLV